MTKKNAVGTIVAASADQSDIETPSVEKMERSYGANQESPMESWEAVRKRPGMYIGDVGVRGLHHMFKEVIDNAIDEVLAGHCTAIKVVYGADHTLSVEDNGRGIPIDINEETGKNIVEFVFTELSIDFIPREGKYKVSGGLHGIGLCPVNVLSAWLECEVKHDGKVHRQRFERGISTSPLTMIGECDRNEQGTKATWLADDTIFGRALDEDGNLYYSPDILRNRIRELAYLHKNVSISFHDAHSGKKPETYHYPQGVASYVAERNTKKELVHPQVFYFEYTSDEMEVDIAMQYTTDDQGSITSFANTTYTYEGGTHVNGFETALKRIVNRYARENGFLSEGAKNFSTLDVRAGLTAIISARMPRASFWGASTDRLSNPEVTNIISRAFGKNLAKFLKDSPEDARAIIDRVSIAAQKRRLTA